MSQRLSELWKLQNYKQDIPFLINRYIYEYDLSSANVAALQFCNYISPEEARVLQSLNKLDREKTIGLSILRDKQVDSMIKQGICCAREMFVNLNQLCDSEIFQIRNDAIFVLDRECEGKVNEFFTFKVKGSYTSYFRLNNGLELFYKFDTMSNSHIFDLKGINDSLIPMHLNGGFLCIVLDIVNLLTNLSAESLKEIYQIASDYSNRNYPVEAYRELGNRSGFHYRNCDYTITMNNGSKIDKSMLSIDYNLEILKNLVGYANLLYFQK